MADMDYYKILGVSRTATSTEIRKAYRALALQHHPDAKSYNASNPDKIREINRAYETLMDAAKRKEYDLTLGGQSPSQSVPRQAPQQTNVGTPPAGRDPFSQIITQMREEALGNAEGRPGVSVSGGPSPAVTIRLTAREAFGGAERQIKVDGRLLTIKIIIES